MTDLSGESSEELPSGRCPQAATGAAEGTSRKGRG
jgi:hypothetical protein